MARFVLVLLVSLGALMLAGCGEPQKHTQEEIQAARQSDPYMRSIDKSRDVAAEASKRTDDPALH